MADPVIKIKRSSVEGKIPTPDQLPIGEVALNTFDGKFYASKNVGIGTTVFVVNPWTVGTGTNTYDTYFTAGNVGVGTTNPSEKLTVSGKIQISQDSGSNNRLIFRGQPGSSYRWNIDNYSSSNEFRIFREDDATAANGSVSVSISTTGTLTANKFSGDGSLLTGIIASSGVVIQNQGSNVGTASTINFSTNLTASFSSGTATISLSNNPSISGILTADQVYTSNNGNGQNVRIGDDFWLGDVNVADTTRFSGAQDSTRAFIIFGSSDAVALGRTGTGPLYYGGNFNVAGVVTATTFIGNLTGTATTATNLSDAANITTGTINSARLSGTYNISISGNASSATYATTAGIATYSSTSGIATYASTAGIATYATTAGIATYSTTADVATNVSGGTASVTSLNVSGISTLGTLRVSSGIVTATSGIITYYGDGRYLNLASNPSTGIGIRTTGSVIGYGITFLDIKGTGVSTTFYNSSVGIATIFFEGGGSSGASVSISTVAPSSPSAGNLWYNSNLGRTFIYYNDGSSTQWVDAAPFNTIVEPELSPGKTSTSYTATASQTTFSLNYEVGYIDVYLNGVRLSASEYTATDGSTIVLSEGASAGDILDVVEFIVGIGATGSGGPLSNVTATTTSLVHYPVIVTGTGDTTPYITTTSNYFSFTPSTGTLRTNQLVVSGVATATDFNSTSDINLKKDVKVIDNPIEKVLQINGVSFNWTDTGQSSAGVIAQDVERVLPEIIRHNPTGYKSLNYNGLIGLLIEGMKEQQKQINTLKQEIENLKK
jgi:hypothetical protein